MDPAYVRRQPWRSTMVSNALGNFQHRALRTLGGLLRRWCLGRTWTVAVARCSGCFTGCGIWNDTVADVNEVPPDVHVGVCADTGKLSNHRCEGVRTEQHRAWTDLSGLLGRA